MPADPNHIEPAPDAVWGALVRIAFDGRNAWRRAVIEQTGLPFSRIRVLNRVYAHGSLTLRELAHASAIDAPAATVAVNDLESRGLVVRDTDPADRRSKRVTITEAGLAMVALAAATPDPPPPQLEQFTVDELRQLADILRRLHR